MVRIAQPIDVIEPQSVQATLGDEAADKSMNGIEGAAVFHAQPGQCVDVEKSPVVDLAAGKSPMRESIVLALEQVMQGENRPGFLSRSISPKPAVDHLLAVDDRREFGLEGWCLVTRRIMQAAVPRRQFEQFAACRLLARAGFNYDFM